MQNQLMNNEHVSKSVAAHMSPAAATDFATLMVRVMGGGAAADNTPARAAHDTGFRF